jgi:hypothetical protein
VDLRGVVHSPGRQSKLDVSRSVSTGGTPPVSRQAHERELTLADETMKKLDVCAQASVCPGGV